MSIAWSLFLISLIPLGVCDTVFDPIRTELQRPHTREAAGRFAGRICIGLGNLIRETFIVACLPALVMNLTWCILGASGRLSRGGRASASD